MTMTAAKILATGILLGLFPGSAIYAEETVDTIFADLLDRAPMHGSLGSMLDAYRAIEKLDADTLLALAKKMAPLSRDYSGGSQMRKVVLTRFAQLDPDAALSYAQQADAEGKYPSAVRIVAEELARSHPGAALAALESTENEKEFWILADALIPVGRDGVPEALLAIFTQRKGISIWSRSGYYRLFESWARKDVRAAFESLDTVTESKDRQQAISGIGNGVPGKDLDLALELAEELIDETERSKFLHGSANSVAKTEPEKAFTFLLKNLPPGDRATLSTYRVSEWFAADPEAARAWVQSLDNWEDRAFALHHEFCMPNKGAEREWLADQLVQFDSDSSYARDLAMNFMILWGISDGASLAAWLKTQPDHFVRRYGLTYLSSTWPERDPAAAAEFFTSEALSPDRDRQTKEFANQITRHFGKVDHQAAIEWIDSLDQSAEARKERILLMAQGWAEADPTAAVAHVFTMNLPPEDEHKTLASLLIDWGMTDPLTALEWADALDDPRRKRAAINGVLAGYAQRRTVNAASLLVQRARGIPGEEIARDFATAIQAIAKNSGNSSPRRIASELSELSDSELLTEALHEVFATFARTEAQQAYDHVMELKPGPKRDGAVSGVVSELAAQLPQGAFELATSIGEEQRRTRTLRLAFDEWKKIDSRAAYQALEASGFGDQVLPPADPPAERDPFSDL